MGSAESRWVLLHKGLGIRSCLQEQLSCPLLDLYGLTSLAVPSLKGPHCGYFQIQSTHFGGPTTPEARFVKRLLLDES